MKCTGCGTENAEGANFCTTCGARMVQENQGPSQGPAPGGYYYPHPGAPYNPYCTHQANRFDSASNSASTVGLNLASIGVRIGAFVIDFLFVNMIFGLTFAIWATYNWTGESLRDFLEINSPEEIFKVYASVFLYVSVLPAVLLGLYFTVFECSGIQGTLGKKLLKLKVINEKGGRISFGAALLRSILKVIPKTCIT